MEHSQDIDLLRDGVIEYVIDDSKLPANLEEAKAKCSAMGVDAVVRLCVNKRLNLQLTWSFVKRNFSINFQEFLSIWESCQQS